MDINSINRLRKGLVFLIIAVMCLTACNHEQPKFTELNISGNSSENINHWGYVALQGNQMYYYLQSNWRIKEGLYTSTREGKNIKRLDKGQISNINAIGDWIYYVKAEKDDAYPNNNVDKYTLYKINVDGSQKTKLIEDCSFVLITENTLYYSVYIARELYGKQGIESPLTGRLGNIYKASLHDLDNKSVLIEEDATSYIVDDSNLYYVTDNGEGNSSLHKFDLRTSKDSIILNDQIYDFTVKNNVVYYTVTTESGDTVKSLSQLTGDGEIIYSSEKQFFNICANETDVFVKEQYGNVLKINLSNPSLVTVIGEADYFYLFENDIFLWRYSKKPTFCNTGNGSIIPD
jgi:hypothetical protein